MKTDNWKKAKEIFGDAIKVAPELRLQYLNEVCADDKIVRREVESLLASYDDAESFMESPAIGEDTDVIENNVKKLEKGKCFGHYEIIEQIGAGGMGEVYLAKDKKLDRRVAIKILNEKFAKHESNLQRFTQEAKAASGLNHPNILVIHEIGETDEAHYIVSEFIEGKTLREIVSQSPMKLSEVLDISIQIVNALATAHAVHIVHRDIKPENIMIRPDGFVKILDFGLAKLVGQKAIGFDDETLKQNETAKGIIMGTVNYMSPEQAKGERVDERTDIFSFGAVVYEMIAGKTPFAGESVSETFANLINAEPQPLSHFAANVPDELQRIVSKMLRKNKDERYQTMKDVLTDLKDLRENLAFDERLEKLHSPSDENATAILQATTGDETKKSAETFSSLSQRIKLHKPAMFALLTALIIASVGIGYVWYSFIKYSPMNFQVQRLARLTTVGKAVSAAVSPDGKYVVYVLEDGGQQTLWLRHIASESTVQLLPPDKNKFSGLRFSPDSNRVYYNAGNSLYQIPVLGGTPAKLLDNVYGDITFSPDAKQIAFVRDQGENQERLIIIADADGTNQRQLISREDLLPTIAWSPDGKVIACPRSNSAELYKVEVLAVQVADGTAALIPSPDWFIVEQLAWMPDGKSLLMVANPMEGADSNFAPINQIWQVQYPSGEARNITKDSNNYTNIGLTADGHSLVSVKLERTINIWIMPARDINRLRQLTFGSNKEDGVSGISWLPDGRIVYDSMPNGKAEAWVVGADGNNSKQLTTTAQTTTVSPDGRYLVFQSPTKETIGLWRMEISDGGKKQITQKVDIYPNFSPDGKWIIYQRWKEQTQTVSLYKVSIDGGEPIQLTNNVNAFSPTVSPDGKHIAFYIRPMEEGNSRQKIALIPFNGGEITKMFDADLPDFGDYGNLQWTPDGRALNYIVLNNGVSNIWRQAIDGSAPVQVTNFTTDLISNFAYSPDGLSLALSRGTLNNDVVLIENVK